MAKSLWSRDRGTQRSLFDPPPNSGPKTSRDAATAIEPNAATLRREVLDFIRRSGGATDCEIQDGLGMAGNTERPRRQELQKAGLIADSGETRKTSSGRAAIVWRATE